MRCMRCGVETGSQQVFCKDCLETMERYPIKPGTPITLPDRRDMPDNHRPARKKRELSPEEQVSRLQRLVQLLSAILVAALITAGIFGALLFVELTDEEPQLPNARNYSTTADW